MLLNLSIKNYALIEELRLEFAKGLNIFTGETGAGKSIIIESLGLILGERASAAVVRKGAERCSISGEFDCARLTELKSFLRDSSLGGDDGEDTLIVRREIDAQGRSRTFVNDRPVSLATVLAVGSYLVDIHGQHEHQSLLRTGAQRALVDSYGDTGELLKETGALFSVWKEQCARRDARQMSEQERERLIDLYRFQCGEIDAVKLYAGEEGDIEAALPQLKNAEKLRELSDEAYQILYGTEGAVLERLSKVQRVMESISALAAALPGAAETLKNAACQLDDVSREVERFRDSLRADPEKLNDLLGRQDLIRKLIRKYGATVADVLAYRDRVGAELAALSKTDENRQELEKKIEKTRAELAGACAKLSAARKKAAVRLAQGVEKELTDLGMKKARFTVAVDKEDTPSSAGWDRIEFMFSANPGEDAKPLKDIASGGEMSRVMLALKSVLAAADRVPVLVFDEIDAGIGGPMGQTVGRKLKALSRHHQVLCITHLPQIAAFGETHLFVEKAAAGGRTFTRVRSLSGKDTVEEIARMLSGEEITPAARKHAQELIHFSDTI